MSNKTDVHDGNVTVKLSRNIDEVYRYSNGVVENFLTNPIGIVELFVSKFNQFILEKQIDISDVLNDESNILSLKYIKEKDTIRVEFTHHANTLNPNILMFEKPLDDVNDLYYVITWLKMLIECMDSIQGGSIVRYLTIIVDTKDLLIKDLTDTYNKRIIALLKIN